jgi:carbonic anhydrase
MGSKPPSVREFWFRLSTVNLYYSVYQEDVNILGALPIKEIIRIDEIVQDFIEGKEIFCFYILDKLKHDWRLCNHQKEISMKWMCFINNLIGKSSKNCEKDTNDPTIIEEHTVIQPVIIIPLPSRFCNQDWNYQQTGADWECGCSEGKEQSPIDLPHKLNAIDSAIAPLFLYNNIGADNLDLKNMKDYLTFKKDKITLAYQDNMLKILYEHIGKITTADGSTFIAKEIVFHTPAEHTIEGKRYDMEIQIIHHGVKEIGKQTTLSFLIEKTPGIYNQFFDELNFFYLPNQVQPETVLEQLYLPKIFYEKTNESDEYNTTPDIKPFSFYTYQGSLTFPPCSENTIVYVASKPIKLGSTALSLFQEALKKPDYKNELGDIITSDWIPISNRSVQARNGRPIFFYDHEKYCGPDADEKHEEEQGHFEKITTTIDKYFYVTNEKPSGMPHSFVVSKTEAEGLTPIAKDG